MIAESTAKTFCAELSATPVLLTEVQLAWPVVNVKVNVTFVNNNGQ